MPEVTILTNRQASRMLYDAAVGDILEFNVYAEVGYRAPISDAAKSPTWVAIGHEKRVTGVTLAARLHMSEVEGGRDYYEMKVSITAVDSYHRPQLKVVK